MLKIAVASDHGIVTQHFGHCQEFVVFEAKNNQITKTETLPNPPGHKPGFLPNFLAEQGVNVIISGGMGGAAVAIFNEKTLKSSLAPVATPTKLLKATSKASSNPPAPFAMSTSIMTNAVNRAFSRAHNCII